MQKWNVENLMVTVHKLLLAKANKLPSGKKISSLQSTSGTKGPARTTGALIKEKKYSLYTEKRKEKKTNAMQIHHSKGTFVCMGTNS